MSEGKRVVAGEAILSGAITTDSKSDRSHAEAGPVESVEASLEALVREHSRLVYRIAYSVLRSHHDAEDATQETFLRVLRYRSKLPELEQPKTWLARIAWRVSVDRSRKRVRAREVTLDDPERPVEEFASADASADESFIGGQVGDALEALIAALPEKLRAPLVLSTIEEMSPREVASALELNEAAVRSRVFRARQILRQKLAARMNR